jgi:uncharacterized protein (DUF1800 family)
MGGRITPIHAPTVSQRAINIVIRDNAKRVTIGCSLLFITLAHNPGCEETMQAPISDSTVDSASPETEAPVAHHPAELLVLLAATTLAACGGGGSSGATPSTSSSPAPVPDPVAAPTAAQAARFLHQAQFSASSTDIAAVQTLGFAAWLDQQLSATPSITGWDWLMSKGYNSAAQLNAAAPADYMVWNQLMTATDTVRKRMALALSEICVVSTTGVSIASQAFAMAAYWDTLVIHAFGNYRQLLEAITLNPAMGVYLNTKGNQKEDLTTGRQPDENYAREVMQLLVIGLYELNLDGSLKLGSNGQPIETYTQDTVTNLAKAFTGWDFDSTGATATTNPLQVKTPMRLTASRHSTLATTFLGTTIPANTDGTATLKIALDTLFNHPNVAPFISKQLIQRLVTSNPSSAYVGRIATVFNNNGAGVRGDLKAVIRALLLDDEAHDATVMAQPTWGKLREPIVRLVQWARTFKAGSATGDWKISDMTDGATRLGQSPLRAGSVFNFFRPGYVPPNTALATAALVGPEFQIANETSLAGYINFMTNTVPVGYSDVAPDYTEELALVNDTTALTDRLNLLLCAGQLSSATLASIKTAIETVSTSTSTGQKNRVYAAIVLTMASPQYIVQK